MTTAIPQVALNIVELPVAAIHANPWNPNVQSQAVRRAQRQSLETWGMIQPITVRPHPDIPGEWQIINGEHRWTDAQELGLVTLPAVVLADLDEADARKLTVVLNETAGDPDPTLLGELLLDLQRRQGELLGHALPYTTGELEKLLEGAGEASPPPPVQHRKEANLERQITLAYMPDRHQQFNDFLLVLKQEHGGNSVSEIVFDAVRRQALAATRGD